MGSVEIMSSLLGGSGTSAAATILTMRYRTKKTAIATKMSAESGLVKRRPTEAPSTVALEALVPALVPDAVVVT